MGESAAETVREIEQTRDRLETHLRDLEEHLPKAAAFGKRVVGLAVGGGVGSTAVMFALKRFRRKRKQAKEQERLKAQARAAVPLAVAQALPAQWADRVSTSLEDGQMKTLLLVAGGVWVALRLAEMRQTRMLNRRLMMAQAVGPLT